MSSKTVQMTAWVAIDSAVDLHAKREQLEQRRDHWLLIACDSESDDETKDAALCKAEEAEMEMQKLL